MLSAILLTFLALFAVVQVLGFLGACFILYDPTRIPHVVFPDRFGLPHEKVAFKNADGQTLRGWILPAARSSGRAVMLCHGWGDNKGHILEQTKFLHARGLDLFYFDFRGCGESEGKLGTIGYLEARDFDAALEFLRSERPAMLNRLGLFGQSMGGSVALAGAARHPSVFKAVAVESCYLSYNLVLPTYAKAKWGLPNSPLFPAIRWWTRRLLGADPEGMSPVYFMDRLRETPVLYLWSSTDLVMPLEWGRRLSERTPGPKELVVIEGGLHGQLWETAPRLYEERMGAFFDRYL